MQPGLQSVEREHVADGQYKLAVKRELFAVDLPHDLHRFREVAAKRLPGLGRDLDVITLAEDKGTEAVPL